MTEGAGRRLARKVRGRLRRVATASRPPDRLRRGTPREVVEEKTNIGPVMDAAVARTRRRMQPAGIDADYDLAYEHFDLTHFLLQARHVLSSETIDPLRHFLGNGAEARGQPRDQLQAWSVPRSATPRRRTDPSAAPTWSG